MTPDDQKFPNAGTDRRPDELKRSLAAEDAAAVSLERAVETDRVATEDRDNSERRAKGLEGLINSQRRLIDIVALAVLLILLGVIVASVAVAIL